MIKNLCIGTVRECKEPVSVECPDGELCQGHLDAHIDNLVRELDAATAELERYMVARWKKK